MILLRKLRKLIGKKEKYLSSKNYLKDLSKAIFLANVMQ
jgi:hypothetical protein